MLCRLSLSVTPPGFLFPYFPFRSLKVNKTPPWLMFLKNPTRALKKKKEDFLEKNKYGPPYIQNEEMLEEFTEE